MKWLLLFIKKTLYKLGVNISFVRKEEERSAIELNEVDSSNQAWSDEKRSKLYLSKEVIKRYQETISFLKERDIELAGKSVVDVGCGNGMLLKFISENYNISSQTGIEHAKAATEVAAKLNPEAEYIVHDINHPYPKRYDAVICTEVLEHILHPVKAFRNMLEMVQDGGIMLITVPNGRYDTFTGHINFWSPESWDAFISENSGGLKYSTGKVEKTLIYAVIWNNRY
jgi:2-polyprenyl-3-methyl-5-hydroxy-6-metoxy-1,4-benzoquinol methylase